MQQLRPNRLIKRREALLTASALVLTAGCRNGEPEEVAAGTERRDVPLRIAMVGSEQDAEILTRAWASVMPQPLTIKTLAISRDAASKLSKLPDLAKSCDVLIYPMLAVPDLYVAEAMAAITAEEFEAGEEALGQFYPAVKNGAAMYAAELLALPLGVQLPALVTTDDADPLESWAAYDDWVKANSDRGISICEPLAPGWAGAMFLWRAASTLETGWLFEREGMMPLVDTEPYVAVLQQMKTTADRYKAARLTPQEIFSRILAGELGAGICFQATPDDQAQVNVLDLPGSARANRLLLDPFSPVVSISSACRQTSASKEFARWLSGGEGSDSVRRQIPGMTETRGPKMSVLNSEPQQAANYGQWLRQRLGTPVTLPAMQLLSGAEYYVSLDQQIGLCLDGQATAEETLSAVADQWRQLNDSVGVEKQERAWRRAQGMRA